MELTDVVMRLIGPVKPIGESNEDAKRLQNCGALIDIADFLLLTLNECAVSRNRQEASMKAIGELADEQLNEWGRWLSDKEEPTP